MQITIQSQDFTMTSAMQEHITRRLRFALSRSADRIRRVTVRLADVNGPRGGMDKRCRIQVEMPTMASIVTEDVDANMYAAISRSAARAGRAVVSKLKRHQVLKRAAPKGGELPNMSETN